MHLSRFFKKPEYFFRPHQIGARLKSMFFAKKSGLVTLPLLEQKFSVNPRETVGKSLLHFGVYDLVLSEVLWRLSSPGQKVADVGANIGYFSLLLGHRVGRYGEVHCFEPHPELQKRWQGNLRKMEQCRLYSKALSSHSGEMELFIPNDFSGNEGIASLEKTEGASAIKVPVTTLDIALKNKGIDLIKLDVEGHELEVLRGGIEVLKEVKTILFEDFHHTQSKTIDFLKSQNFTVYRLAKGFFGIQLLSVEEGEHLPLWEPPNYIATREIQNVQQKIAARGWRCLRFL